MMAWLKVPGTSQWERVKPPRESGRCSHCDGWHRSYECPDLRDARIAQDRDDHNHKPAGGW